MGIYFKNAKGSDSSLFNNEDTNLEADTMEDAVKEVNAKIDSLPPIFGYRADKVTPQEFTDYSGVRDRDIEYTNDTGSPISLYVWTTISSASSGIKVTITDINLNSHTFSSSTVYAAGDSNNRQSLQVIIPVGATYTVINRSPDVWIELR